MTSMPAIDRSPGSRPVALGFLWLLLLGVTVSLGGDLLGADLLAVLVGGGVLVVSLRFPQRVVTGTKTLLVLVLVWFLAQFVADVANSTDMIDRARGLSNIAVFALATVGFGRLLRDVDPQSAVLPLAAAAALGLLVAEWGTTFSGLWKFSLALPVTLAVAALADRTRSTTVLVLVAGAVATLDLVLNARAAAATLLAAVILVVLAPWARSGSSTGWMRITSLVALLVAGALLAALVYPTLAQEGLFGEDARRKAALQSSGELGILVGGRPTLLIAAEAIRESPWVGHGSWAADQDVVDRGVARGEELGYREYRPVGADLRIPAHSYLLGAWTDGGVAGALVWIGLGLVVARAFLDSWRTGNMHLWEAFGYTTLAWDFFFSPFSGSERILTALVVVLLLRQREVRAHGRPEVARV